MCVCACSCACACVSPQTQYEVKGPKQSKNECAGSQAKRTGSSSKSGAASKSHGASAKAKNGCAYMKNVLTYYAKLCVCLQKPIIKKWKKAIKASLCVPKHRKEPGLYCYCRFSSPIIDPLLSSTSSLQGYV